MPLPGARESSDELNLAALERHTIQRALERSSHNLSGAARLLGIDRSTLWRKLRVSGVTVEQPEP